MLDAASTCNLSYASLHCLRIGEKPSRFAVFHRPWDDNKVIYVNPLNAIAIERVGDTTSIITPVMSRDEPYILRTVEDVASARDKLEDAMQS